MAGVTERNVPSDAELIEVLGRLCSGFASRDAQAVLALCAPDLDLVVVTSEEPVLADAPSSETSSTATSAAPRPIRGTGIATTSRWRGPSRGCSPRGLSVPHAAAASYSTCTG
jgi:hypothetical protein